MVKRFMPLVPDGTTVTFDSPQARSQLQSALISYLGLEPGFNEIAQEITIDFLRAFDSRWVHFAQLQTDATLSTLGFFGLSAEDAKFLNGVSIWDSCPMSIAARDGQIAVHGDGSDPTVKLPSCLKSQNQELIVVAAPLILSLKVIGVLSVGFQASNSPINSITQAVESIAEIILLYLAGARTSLDGLVDAGATERESTQVNHDQRSSSLSQRQLAILGLLAKGLTYDQIGNRIGFSHSTVRMELMQIYRVFGVNSRDEAIEWAHDHKLIPVDISEFVKANASDNPGGGSG